MSESRRRVTREDKQEMLRLQQEGYSQDKIAELTGRSRSTVRYALVPKRRELEKARLRVNKPSPNAEFIMSAPQQLALLDDSFSGFIYRLWREDGVCLYVGQSTQITPALRIVNHRCKDWWKDVASADYVKVTGDLDKAEFAQVQTLRPLHNVHHS